MKLSPLSRTTLRLSQAAIARARQTEAHPVQQVDALEGIEGDRTRTLQQELAEVEPGAVADFAGQAEVLREAQAVAAQLAALGSAADGLLKDVPLPGVDDSV